MSTRLDTTSAMDRQTDGRTYGSATQFNIALCMHCMLTRIKSFKCGFKSWQEVADQNCLRQPVPDGVVLKTWKVRLEKSLVQWHTDIEQICKHSSTLGKRINHWHFQVPFIIQTRSLHIVNAAIYIGSCLSSLDFILRLLEHTYTSASAFLLRNIVLNVWQQKQDLGRYGCHDIRPSLWLSIVYCYADYHRGAAKAWS